MDKEAVFSMGDFWPIALPNFQFKIITKILADVLAIISTCIISLHLIRFVRDQHISHCVIVAFETINLLDKKQFGTNFCERKKRKKMNYWKKDGRIFLN